MFLLAIKFDWSMIFGFFAGIFFGASLLALIYLFFALSRIKKNKKVVIDRNKVKKDTIERIENYKLAFKEANLKGNDALNYTKELCIKLVNDTALQFFPNSKYPIYELSIDEVLTLVTYIDSRIDDLLNHKLFKPLKTIKISTILSLTETKSKIESNIIVTNTKKYKIKSTLKATSKVLNLINPLWWAKNIVVDKTIDIILKKLCIVIIDIVGEETYNIYSKHIFDDDDNIKTLDNYLELDEEVGILNEEEQQG